MMQVRPRGTHQGLLPGGYRGGDCCVQVLPPRVHPKGDRNYAPGREGAAMSERPPLSITKDGSAAQMKPGRLGCSRRHPGGRGAGAGTHPCAILRFPCMNEGQCAFRALFPSVFRAAAACAAVQGWWAACC